MAYTHDDDGKKHIHLIYGPGAYFPVITTFRDTPQRASYEALTSTAAQVFTHQQFIQQLQDSPAFCRQILDKTVNQLTIFANRVVELQTTRLEDKLLERLSIMAHEHGQATPSGTILPYVLKHHHLADMLGVERESLTRALSRLRKRNLITSTKQGHFVIHS